MPAELPDGLTGDKLREVAKWLDLYDELGQKFIAHLAKSSDHDPEQLANALDVISGTEMQDDLRRWADQIDSSGTA